MGLGNIRRYLVQAMLSTDHTVITHKSKYEYRGKAIALPDKGVIRKTCKEMERDHRHGYECDSYPYVCETSCYGGVWRSPYTKGNLI